MSNHGFDSRRILLLSAHPQSTLALLVGAPEGGWEVVTADSSAAAALLLQNTECDLLLADESHYQQEGIEGLVWLVQKEILPIVLLADARPEVVAGAYERGVSLWLPLRQVQHHPALLLNALDRTVLWNDLQQRQRRTRESLDNSQRQVDRLVSLLWRTAPMTVEKRWYTHRHMLERLEEELARAERYKLPLTIALGEVDTTPLEVQGRAADVFTWAVDEVVRRKRRGDVAGQYGLRGFMLLMTHTPGQGGASCCRRIQFHLEQSGGDRFGVHEPISTYFGVSSFSPQANTSQALLRIAEEHLDAAKRGQGERVVAP
jgi:GGDEF domain-containing protein